MGIGTGRAVDALGEDGVLYEIVSTVAEAEGVEPTELPPIYDRIDTDALAEIIRIPSMVDCISFTYHGWKIEIEPSTGVTISDRAVES